MVIWLKEKHTLDEEALTLIRARLADLLPYVEVLFHLQVNSFENLKEFAEKFVGKCCRDCIKHYGGRENFIVTFLRHFVWELKIL